MAHLSTVGHSRSAPSNGAKSVGSLPSNPFYATRYHFGMLLGVDDFETEQAYHRGKQRLHNAWLHGEGVVWGLDVAVPPLAGDPDTLQGEVRVEPGLALDLAGRELYLGVPACLSVAAWYEANRDDPALQTRATEDGFAFDAHVVIRFRACLSRPVPAMSEPCSVGTGGTAYSRIQETVELLILPGLAERRALPYHRLRLLFALEDPALDADGDPLLDDQEVLDERERILTTVDAADQPRAYLEAFRRFAALDEIDLRPCARPEGGGPLLFPADDDTEVLLANLRGLTLEEREGGLLLTAVEEVERTVRPAHVATSTIQELLCGPLFALLASPPPPDDGDEEGPGEPDDEPVPGDGEPVPGDRQESEDGGSGDGPAAEDPIAEGRIVSGRSPVAELATGGASRATPDAGGPRFDPGSVSIDGEVVTLRASSPLSRQSVTPAAFSVSSYNNRSGWQALELSTATLDAQSRSIRLELRDGSRENLIRLIARGTGPTPLLGTNLVPLAGAVGGPAGSEHDGHDFVFMLTRR